MSGAVRSLAATKGTVIESSRAFNSLLLFLLLSGVRERWRGGAVLPVRFVFGMVASNMDLCRCGNGSAWYRKIALLERPCISLFTN